MDRRKLEELLDKYSKGQCDPEEVQLLENWLSNMDRMTRNEQVFTSEDEAKKLEHTIWQSLHIEKSNHRISRLWPLIGKTAAMLVIGIGIFMVAKTKYAGSSLFARAVTWDTISVPQQAIKRVMLTDGSEVYLNAGSSIRYSSAYGTEKREVELLFGEARFDVVHDKKHPFIVHSGGLKTYVLGTQFTVTAYPSLKKIHVSVNRGKVSVLKDQQQISVLTQGQEVNYNLLTHVAERGEGKISAFNPEAQSSMLNNCSFNELALRIENAFGYTLIAKNKLIETYKFTGDIRFGEPLPGILKKLCAIHGNQFSIAGKEVYMY
ncbi:FecR family protein [Pedobacter sp. BS3]|uniref:FecR family protein n=1 Tax=Pedobacter sp. BS3 TaxID=2567937 RepID=UPI0011EE4571|nr:FecR family protein [Pedobacter sp. BS3]TZF84789.1 FecR family protein [Pedobacter sp. BS3]